jgi:dTDP-4-amino-4,6-dideoxygalactose transaminase
MFWIPDQVRNDRKKRFSKVSDRIMDTVTAEGVPCFSGSCSEIYLEKAFDQGALRPKERLPVAKKLGETSLMFMVHPTLTESDMVDTCKAVAKVMAMAAR